jgi:hypothetical protein
MQLNANNEWINKNNCVRYYLYTKFINFSLKKRFLRIKNDKFVPGKESGCFGVPIRSLIFELQQTK